MITKSARGALLFVMLLRFSIPASAARSTNITVSSATVTYGGPTSLQATLTVDGRPARSERIDFALNGSSVGSASTNSRGVATLNVNGLNAGTYAINAVFAGDNNLQGSQGTANLKVNQAAASVTPNAVSKTYGASDPPLTGTLSGFLPSDAVMATYTCTACSTVEGSPYTISA